MQAMQRRAVLAIISMIESGLRELRLMFTEHAGSEEPGFVAHRQKLEPQFGSPLDDDEERSLEQVMELSRQDMLKRGTNLTQQFYGDAAPPVPGGFFEGDDL